MKKIALILTFAAFAFTANAQLIISANIGGSKTSITNSTTAQIVVGADSIVPPVITPVEANSNFSGGLKIGYKFGKAQVGIAASYNKYTIGLQPLDPTLIPIIGVYEGVTYGIPTITTTGTMSTTGSSITIAPYFRYDMLVAGDVSIFAELNVFYTMNRNPEVTFTELNVGPAGITLPQFVDSTVTRPISSTSLGVSVVPGLSWQLSKHCAIDLYLDFLSLAYRKTTTNRIDFAYTPRMTNDPLNPIEVNHTETTVITEESTFGGGLTGTPLLTNLGQNNWVRVGFNFTF